MSWTPRSCCSVLFYAAQFLKPPAVRTFSGDSAKVDLAFVEEQHCKVRTCVDLYRQWRKTKPYYKNAPEDGIVVDVPFFSTMVRGEQSCRPLEGSGPPLAVMLHGSPGSYRDFSQNLIPTLRDNGVDVLAPDFPSLKFSLENKFFWHTVEERTALLKDWLAQMGVRRIDTLIAHSAAVYPALRITLQGTVDVKSLVLLAPNSHKAPRVIQPVWLTTRLVSAYKYSLLRPWVRGLVRTSLIFGAIDLKPVIDDVMLSLMTYLQSGYQEGDKMLRQIAEQRLPTLVAIGRNDRLLQFDVLCAVCEALGARQEDFWCYDCDGHLKSQGAPSSWLKVLCFDDGTHYPFVRRPDICGREVLQLLQRIGALRS